MKNKILAVVLGSVALGAIPAAAPGAMAQTRAEQARWDAAQARFDNEQRLYDRERRIYENAVRRDGRYNDDVPPPPPPGGPAPDDRFATDYDAARYYRDDPRYTERRLGPSDQVYRGSDGRYYCKRTDGTTGLIVGGATGALLGNVIDGGRHRTGGTLIGGALGALLGKSVEQQNNDVRCR